MTKSHIGLWIGGVVLIFLGGCEGVQTTQTDIPKKPSHKETNTSNNPLPQDTRPSDSDNDTTPSHSTYSRIKVDDPLHPPKGSMIFSYRDALPHEPLSAMVEFTEDVSILERDAFRLEGGSLNSFDRITPKLYRLIIAPDPHSQTVTLHLDASQVVDRDGHTLQNDLDASASIAQAPWAQKIRRYRGTIEATYEYQNIQGEHTTFLFLWIRPGTFAMGCSGFDEHHCQTNETAHQVTLTKGFWLGRTEVTQQQWSVVMQSHPSYFNQISTEEAQKMPVEQIRYTDAVAFTRKLLDVTTAHAHLPTEAEWEYAMRSSTTTAFYDNPDDIRGDANSKAAYYIGWYAGNSSEWTYQNLTQPQPANGVDLSKIYAQFYTKPTTVFGTHYIMQKANSDWRLKDMAGNVAEWCRDWYQQDLGRNDISDPTGPVQGTLRVVRGGSWYDGALKLRAASREGVAPDTASYRIGMRIAIYPGGRQ